MVSGDNEGEGLALVRHLCQDLPVETKNGSWLGQSLERQSLGPRGSCTADDRETIVQSSGGAQRAPVGSQHKSQVLHVLQPSRVMRINELYNTNDEETPKLCR